MVTQHSPEPNKSIKVQWLCLLIWKSDLVAASCINRAVNYARATHLNVWIRWRCCKINYKAHSAESTAQPCRVCVCNSLNVHFDFLAALSDRFTILLTFPTFIPFSPQLKDLYYFDKLFLSSKSQTKQNFRGRLLLDSRLSNWTLLVILERLSLSRLRTDI